jgi:quercetin dioxygenase-like cupin family protein
MITVRWIDAVRRLGLATVAMVVAGAAMTPAQAGPEKADQPRLGNGEAVKVEPRFQSLIEGKKVLSIVRVVIAPGVTEHRHRHPGLEIVYVLNGSGSIDIDGKSSSLSKGTVIPVPAGATKALTNASRAKPLEVLAVLALEPGAPPVSMIDEGPRTQSHSSKAGRTRMIQLPPPGPELQPQRARETAEVSVEQLSDGRRSITSRNALLKGVSPEMPDW